MIFHYACKDLQDPSITNHSIEQKLNYTIKCHSILAALKLIKFQSTWKQQNQVTSFHIYAFNTHGWIFKGLSGLLICKFRNPFAAFKASFVHVTGVIFPGLDGLGHLHEWLIRESLNFWSAGGVWGAGGWSSSRRATAVKAGWAAWHWRTWWKLSTEESLTKWDVIILHWHGTSTRRPNHILHWHCRN